MGPVRELVVAGDVSLVAAVVLLDEVLNVGEVAQAGLELIEIVVLPVEHSAEVHVLELNVRDSVDGADGSSESEGFHLQLSLLL